MKRLQNSISWKVMASFTMVLVGILIVTSMIMNYYSTRFIQEQIVKYNSQTMSKTIYDLNSLFDRVTQFATNNNQYVFEEVSASNQKKMSFSQLKKQVDFEKKMKDSISSNSLGSIVSGVIIYYDDDRVCYVGDGVLDSQFKFSQASWYQDFLENSKASLIVGPVTEGYKPKNMVKGNVLLYIKQIPYSVMVKTDKVPCMVLAIKFSEIKSIFKQLDSQERGIAILDNAGNEIYSNQISEEKLDLIREKTLNSIKGTKDLNYTTYSDSKNFITSMYSSTYNWTISTVDSNGELFASVYDLIRTINIFIALCGFIGILACLALSKRLMLPIQILYRFMSRIEEENDAYIEVKGEDEIGQIGRRFNQMKDRLKEQDAKRYLAEVREKEAQLNALQAQINPHFLYNTLDNIYCIAQIEEIEPIVKLTKSLSDMMRYSINYKDMYTELSQEVEHVKSYVEIINERYEDSIELVIEMEEGLKSVGTIKLLLQPIVENAWIHGILPKKEHKGRILIRAVSLGDELEILVEDDGVGIEEERILELNHQLCSFHKEIRTPQNKGFGIALINVNDRIKLMDGENYGIQLEMGGHGGVAVRIRQKMKRKK